MLARATPPSPQPPPCCHQIPSEQSGILLPSEVPNTERIRWVSGDTLSAGSGSRRLQVPTWTTQAGGSCPDSVELMMLRSAR
jgi:hypothetical protein